MDAGLWRFAPRLNTVFSPDIHRKNDKVIIQDPVADFNKKYKIRCFFGGFTKNIEDKAAAFRILNNFFASISDGVISAIIAGKGKKKLRAVRRRAV
ncbi:MAG: hypothetical protein J5482_02385 [Oscillospiraceae bacterium]|nr:hypothetical protein [Oscillospiraceae bacterium]